MVSDAMTKEARQPQWRKDNHPSKCCWENGTATCKAMKV